MLNCVEAGKPPTALADARQVSEPGDGGATSPAITAVIGERVRDDAGRHQSLFESALLAEIKELKRAISAQQANYERQQANYARFMENVGHAVVSGSNSLSPQTSADHGVAAVGLTMTPRGPPKKESGGPHDAPESRDEPVEPVPYHDDEESDERRAYCNPCDSNSDVVDAEYKDFQGMAEADAVELVCRRGWSIIKVLLPSKEEAIKQFRTLTLNRFKQQERISSAKRTYYKCAVHVGCACTYRISRSKNGWVIAKRWYEDHERNDLPEVQPIKRVVPLIPIDGEGDASEDGVTITRSTLNGPFRGVSLPVQSAIWRLHTEHGYSGHAILQHLEKDTSLWDVPLSRAKLPTVKQIYNVLHYMRKRRGVDRIDALALQSFTAAHAAPQTRQTFDEYHRQSPHKFFMLTFDLSMLSAEELERAKNHKSGSAGKSTHDSLRDNGDKVAIFTTTTQLLHASNNVDAWGDALVLGGDGVHNISEDGTSCIVSIGGFRNYALPNSGGIDSHHSYDVWGLVWSNSENITMVAALFASLRAFMVKMNLSVPRVVATWNSDLHASYAALRDIFFPVAVPLPCAVHIQRELHALKSKVNDDAWEVARRQLEALKHAQNDLVFNQSLRQIIEYWEIRERDARSLSVLKKFFVRKGKGPHFSMGQSRIPGFAPDNQSIESTMGIIRSMTGGRDHRQKAQHVFYHSVPALMQRLSMCLVDDVTGNLHEVSTFVKSMTLETLQQLKTLQQADTNGEIGVGQWTSRDYDTFVVSAFQQSNSLDAVTQKRNRWILRNVEIDTAFAVTFAEMMTHNDSATWALSLEDVRSCCVVRKLRGTDFPELREVDINYLKKTGFHCTCCHFMRHAQCGHAVFAKYKYDNRPGHESNKLHWSTFRQENLISPKRGYRKRRQPGEMGRKHARVKRGKTHADETPQEVTLSSPLRLKTAVAAERHAKETQTPTQRITSLTATFDAAPQTDKGTRACAEALWLIATFNSSADHGFDAKAARWTSMVKQRGLSDLDAARYVQYIRDAPSSQCAPQWHPTFFQLYFNVHSKENIPVWLYPDNLLDNKSLAQLENKEGDRTVMITYEAGVKYNVQVEDVFRADSVEMLDDIFINAMAVVIQGNCPRTAILPTHFSQCKHDTSKLTLHEQYQNAYEMCEFGQSKDWWLKTDIFIPWHIGAHWYLYHIRICTTGKIVITSYDSLGKPQSNDKKQTHKWLEEFMTHTLHVAGDAATTRFLPGQPKYEHHYGQPPRQKDAVSCGVYVLLNIVLLRLGVQLDEHTYMAMKSETYVRGLFRSAILRAKELGFYDVFKDQPVKRSARIRLRSQSYCNDGCVDGGTVSP